MEQQTSFPSLHCHAVIPSGCEWQGDRDFLLEAKLQGGGQTQDQRCDTLFVVLDINGDGIFDRRDFSRGTTIGLDRNGDGRIWGKDEWSTAKEIISYCGASLLIENIEPDGSAITLTPTSLRVPKLGESLPAFSLETQDGKTINSYDLKGKLTLLDFWASWCKPCTEKFPDLTQLSKTFGDRLGIISINIDDQPRWEEAKQIIRRYRLTWPQVVARKGEDDPIWKMFGGMANNQLGIPYYVLVDPHGRLSYAGQGGADLSELRGRIEELLPKGNRQNKRTIPEIVPEQGCAPRRDGNRHRPHLSSTRPTRRCPNYEPGCDRRLSSTAVVVT